MSDVVGPTGETSPPLYPICLRLDGRLCVVVGGGPVAERKVNGLLSAGARIRVVALSTTPGLYQRAESGEIELELRAYDKTALAGAILVFAATDRREVNVQVAVDAADAGAWVNVADAPDTGDFVTPAVVGRGGLLLSVTTGGSQPLLAARIADRLAAQFGPEYAELVALLGRMRVEVRTRAAEAGERRAAYEALVAHETELIARLAANDFEGAEACARALVSEALGG
jgi:precorrin-2 dehydrogenase/sirohydrochlorin ferrochelatase